MNLDLFKERWKNIHLEGIKVTENEIKTIITKKSKSSIRSFIFVSTAEFLLFISIGLFYGTELSDSMMYKIFGYFEIFNYGVLIFFVLMFVYHLTRIETTSSINNLLHDLLRVRGDMKKYVIYNISVFVFSAIYLFVNEMLYNPNISNLDLSPYNKIIISSLFSLFVLIASVAIYFAYLFFYGRFISRIEENYKTLQGKSKVFEN